MFYVLQSSKKERGEAIALPSEILDKASNDDVYTADLGDEDIDFVDDTLLNVAPHNPIERQLLTGDVVGLALMSGAIIWSAMGAIA